MEITVDDILRSFDAQCLSEECMKFFNSVDFSYEILQGKEKEDMVLASLRRIEKDKQAIGSLERTEVWDKGWKENLNAFCKSGNLDDVVPRFIRPNNIIRFNQEFIRPNNPFFERDYCRLFQMWFFRHYLDTFDAVYEFGCGSGFNLISIAKMFPDMKLVGTDFVYSSVDLINELARQKSFYLEGHFFDMLSPSKDFRISPNSCVLTFGALEQLAGKFRNFIDYLVERKVKRCIHVEPIVELYDSDNIVDYLAIMFHKKRGYSEGILPYLRDLHNKGSIKLIKANRLRFGNDCMEGYSYLIWEV